jgi:hypothetical protein
MATTILFVAFFLSVTLRACALPLDRIPESLRAEIARLAPVAQARAQESLATFDGAEFDAHTHLDAASGMFLVADDAFFSTAMPAAAVEATHTDAPHRRMVSGTAPTKYINGAWFHPAPLQMPSTSTFPRFFFPCPQPHTT